MKNQGKVTPSKEHSKCPVIGLKGMKVHEFPEKELEIIIIKMLRKL